MKWFGHGHECYSFFFAMCIFILEKLNFIIFPSSMPLKNLHRKLIHSNVRIFFIVSFSVSYIPLLATKKLGTNHSIERDQHASALTFLCFEIQALQLMDINFKKKKGLLHGYISLESHCHTKIRVKKFCQFIYVIYRVPHEPRLSL